MDYITDFFWNNYVDIFKIAILSGLLAVYIGFMIYCTNKMQVVKRHSKSRYKPKINSNQARTNWMLDRFDEPH